MSEPQIPPADSAVISGDPFQDPQKSLDWSRSDIERKWVLHGGRFTTPGKLMSMILGALLTAAFYAVIVLVQQRWPDTHWFAAMFWSAAPAPTPPCCCSSGRWQCS